MDNIKVTINEDFKFKTLTADDGYIITNTANGFNVDNFCLDVGLSPDRRKNQPDSTGCYSCSDDTCLCDRI